MRTAWLVLLASALWAQPQPQNIDHIWGRITKVTKGRFEVDQNFNADPQSAYRRRMREITFDAQTKFQSSAPEDLRAGRTVDIIGIKTSESQVEATRVIVYEGNKPVGMRPGMKIVAPDGSVRTTQ